LVVGIISVSKESKSNIIEFQLIRFFSNISEAKERLSKLKVENEMISEPKILAANGTEPSKDKNRVKNLNSLLLLLLRMMFFLFQEPW
jgi:hypothetical protein